MAVLCPLHRVDRGHPSLVLGALDQEVASGIVQASHWPGPTSGTPMPSSRKHFGEAHPMERRPQAQQGQSWLEELTDYLRYGTASS